MAIEEAGPDPAAMATEIHAQLGHPTGAIDMHRLAFDLKIVEFRAEPLANLEGALLTTDGKGYGSILVNANSSPQRQRFTIAHELCHFLHPAHQPVPGIGFHCTAQDLAGHSIRSRTEQDRHARQEREANRFAIELLVPASAAAASAGEPPNLAHVLQLSAAYDVSREAAARRYAEQHTAPIAIVFSHKNRVRYAVKSPTMPSLRLTTGFPLPPLSAARSSADARMTARQEMPASQWLTQTGSDATVTVQTLFQQNGYAMTMITQQ